MKVKLKKIFKAVFKKKKKKAILTQNSDEVAPPRVSVSMGIYIVLLVETDSGLPPFLLLQA